MKFASSNIEGINGLVGSEPEEAPTMETEKHTELVYSCDKCDYTINNALLLTEHAATHHERAHFPCDECPFVAKNKGGLTRHTNSKHKLSYSCDSCDYIPQTEPDLMEHHKSNDNMNASTTSTAVEESTFFMFNFPINFHVSLKRFRARKYFPYYVHNADKQA